MTLRKFLTYLYGAGCLLFAMYLIGSLALYHTMYGFKESDALRYLMYVGVLILFPLEIYKLFHFKEFKSENKHNLITWGILIVLAIVLIIIKG